MFDVDIKNIQDSTLLNDQERVYDVVISDGSDWTSFYDVMLLKSRCRVLVLDDVNGIKHAKTREVLLRDPHFTLIQENLDERNGYSVFIKLQ
jgi:hypothetical protein